MRTLQVSATPTTGGSPTYDNLLFDAARGLTAQFESCAQAWSVDATAGTATCGATGGASVVNATRVSLSSLRTVPVTLVPATSTIAPGAVLYYKVSLQLQDNDENSLNGAVASPSPSTLTGSVQGLTTSIDWKFNEVQRAATTTNS